MSELWIASGNVKKQRELERLLSPLGYAIRTLDELPAPVEIVEDRETFAGNAAAKAVPLARAVNGLAIGDDSGLCVDALGGRPGVRSARYGGPDASDPDRISKLLAELDGVPSRSARFTCAICLAGPGGPIATFEEHCRGRIVASPRGESGFGYDPVFAAAGLEGTFAELSPDEKDAISHRGKALRRLIDYLATLGDESRRL